MSADPQRARVRASAPAKLNAWLAVRGRRADGYHEIESLLVALDLCDQVEVAATATSGVALTVRGPAATPDVPADERNLAWRAAHAVLERARAAGAVPRGTGLAVALEKRVPSQAGLGGGSSDAAAACVAAERALGIDLGREAALELLAALGSDCAFFRRASDSGVARCTGRGEIVEPLPAIDPGWSFALVTPDVTCATGAVYGALAAGLSNRAPVPSLRADVFALPLEPARAGLFNQLEDAALAVAPALAAWRALFARLDLAHFRLAGSGSSFFGIFRDSDTARGAVERVQGEVRRAGLALRLACVARPAGHGARIDSCV